jgi:hypothetical protein
MVFGHEDNVVAVDVGKAYSTRAYPPETPSIYQYVAIDDLTPSCRALSNASTSAILST